MAVPLAVGVAVPLCVAVALGFIGLGDTILTYQKIQ